MPEDEIYASTRYMTAQKVPTDEVIDLAGFRVAFSQRSDGNMDARFDPPEVVTSRRSHFTQRLFDSTGSLHMLDLGHSPNVMILQTDGASEFRHYDPIIDTDFPGYETKADCMISLAPSALLGMVSADCIPIGIVAHTTGIFGLAHVGLLGLLNGNLANIVNVFESIFVQRHDLDFVIGPAISGEAYNLGKSGLWQAIEAQVRSKRVSFLDYLDKRNEGPHLDVRKVARLQLAELGIKPSRIRQHGGSTGGDQFFSNYESKRSQTKDGRFLTVIGQVPDRFPNRTA